MGTIDNTLLRDHSVGPEGTGSTAAGLSQIGA